jgi:hypothetical protein
MVEIVVEATSTAYDWARLFTASPSWKSAIVEGRFALERTRGRIAVRG